MGSERPAIRCRATTSIGDVLGCASCELAQFLLTPLASDSQVGVAVLEGLQHEASMRLLKEISHFPALEGCFSSLDGSERKAIADMLDVLQIEQGEMICTEGQPPTGFYIMVRGECTMLSGKEEIAKLKRGEFFGEMALIGAKGKVEIASVRCESQSTVIRLDPYCFLHVLALLEDLRRIVEASAASRAVAIERIKARASNDRAP